MNNRINEDEVISDLFKSFNQDNVILFVGSSAIDNGELTEKICNTQIQTLDIMRHEYKRRL